MEEATLVRIPVYKQYGETFACSFSLLKGDIALARTLTYANTEKASTHDSSFHFHERLYSGGNLKIQALWERFYLF